MIGIDFIYNGQSFSETLFDTVNGIGIKFNDVNWQNLNTSDDQNNRQGDHGIETSPTYIRGRVIDIRGEIWANSRIQRDGFRQTLQDTFSPPFFPSVQDKGFHDFQLTDDDGLDWIIKAKVLNMPDYNPELSDFTRTPFQIQLITEDPEIVSTTLESLMHVEGFYGGFNLPVKLPIAMDNYGFIANLINSGSWKAPLTTTITANNDTGINMRVINTLDNSFIGIQTAMTTGDILIIDSFDQTITLNGLNFSADRISGSIFHFLLPGNNEFIVRDDLQILGDGLSVDVLFEWRNTKI